MGFSLPEEGLQQHRGDPTGSRAAVLLLGWFKGPCGLLRREGNRATVHVPGWQWGKGLVAEEIQEIGAVGGSDREPDPEVMQALCVVSRHAGTVGVPGPGLHYSDVGRAPGSDRQG